MSSVFRVLFAAVCLACFALNANAGNNPQFRADARQINAACHEDAEAVGCGGLVYGKGLLRCMHEFKRTHRRHRFSAGCRVAMKEMREDRKEARREAREGK